MKKNRSTQSIIAALVAGFLSAQSVHAAVTTWNNAAGGNWSVGVNWDTLVAPGSADDTRFVNTGAGTPTTMDVSRTINSLAYAQDNQALHTTTISAGQTLTVSRTGAGDVLNVGSTGGATTASTLTPATITGSGGTLSLSGTGDLVIKQGNSANGSHMATLDLSGLDTFNATVGRLLIGQGTGTAINRPSGTLILAKTNHITLSGASPQVMLQDSGQNGNNIASVLSFGQETHLFGDVMRLGGQKANANMNFNGAFSLPSLQIRNADGVSRVSIIDFGYNAAASSGNNTVVNADFSPGTVDLMANLVNIAQGNPGGSTSAGTCVSTVTLGAGTFDVNTLEIGWQNATAFNGAVTATVNVNNNGLFASGAVLTANTSLRLARTNGGTGAVVGTLNISGGTVQANTILSGGGNSTITVNVGSTLVISNTAGTLAMPIRNFTIADATLKIPALNGGGVMAVSNLIVAGSANTINISSVPPIGAYPATFTLINYQSGYTAGTGPLSLGTLPSASPAYSGTLVDTGGGVIQLQLTAGPVVDLGMLWKGTTDNNWDTSTYNWTFLGFPTNFFNGSSPVFDDSTAQTNVVLTTTLSPGSITVSNTAVQYYFTGSGNIAGAGSLTKKGSNALIIDNGGVDTIGTVVIGSGTLQLGTGGVDGEISAINITNNGALVVNRSGSLTLGSAISGTGSLTKNGNGTLILSGANSYSGATTLSGGALQVDGTSSGAGALTTMAGTVLAGSGTVSGAVTVGGQLNPGPVAGPGIFKAHGGLTLATSSTLSFDLSATDPSNPAVNDSVDVLGNLNANNNTIAVNIAGTPQNGASYLLFTYSGSLSGSFNPVINGTHFAATLDTSNPGLIYLNITSGAGSDLAWASVSDPAWDSSSTNWINLNSSAPSLFYSGDSVLLDDTAGVVTGITIGSGVNVSPSVITNNSTNNNFIISGAGHISGGASIVKTGPSFMAILTANTFSGTVDVQAGTLQTGNGAALGSSAAGTTVAAGATLDFNGQNLGSEVITISGDGVDGAGALINSGVAQFQAIRQVVLAGDATFGGISTWQINNGGGGASLTTGGNPYKLTKVGANQVSLAQVANVDAALGDIDIQAGILEFSGLTPGMGDSTRTNTVAAGATLSFANGTVTWNKQFIFNGNGATTTVNVGAGGNETLAGPVELHGDCVFNVGGTSLTISGAISGDGGVIKNGSSPLIFTTDNTYTGDTRLNSAALRLNGGSISNSPNIILSAGSTLTVTGLVNSTFTLLNGQTLKGGGVVNGSLVASAGSTVAPGMDAVGFLTVSNSIVLSGTNIMELDPVNGTNDVLRCISSVTYGGTLNLVSLGTLSGGSSYKLFSASSYLGSFSTITPATPGTGLTWDTSALGTTGTIKVVSTTPPSFGNITIVGTTVVLTGSNGVASSPYYVLASTNLSVPLTNWSRIETNTFDGTGHFIFTNSLIPPLPQRFYQIQLP